MLHNNRETKTDLHQKFMIESKQNSISKLLIYVLTVIAQERVVEVRVKFTGLNQYFPQCFQDNYRPMPIYNDI